MTKKIKTIIQENKVDISKMSREEKIKALLNYAKEVYIKENRFVSKREIRKVFHVELYNYFKNIFDMYQNLNLDVPLAHCPREYAINKIIEFVKNKAKEGSYLSKSDIETELNIHIDTYFKDLNDLYTIAGIDYNIVKNSIMKKIILAHTYTSEEIEKQKQSIRDFIQLNVSNGFYPSTQYIQKSLNLSFYNLYDDIYQAYRDANISYERPSPIILGKQKERVLTLIIKELFYRMGYKLLRVSIESKTDFNKFSDMTIIDKDGNKCLVEIKAYRKDYCITKRELNQLSRYMKKENISKGIFITTTEKCKLKMENIDIINGDKIIQFMRKYNLHKYLYSIKWIQESRVNSKEKEEHYNLTREKIIEFVKNHKEFPSKIELEKSLRLDIKTYFGRNPYKKIKEIIKKDA